MRLNLTVKLEEVLSLFSLDEPLRDWIMLFDEAKGLVLSMQIWVA